MVIVEGLYLCLKPTAEDAKRLAAQEEEEASWFNCEERLFDLQLFVDAPV